MISTNITKHKDVFKLDVLYFLRTLYYCRNGLTYKTLKKDYSFQDGQISKIAYFLQEKGYINMEKTIENNRSKTVCKITTEGIIFLESFTTEIIDTLLIDVPKRY
jgi:DNA-binding PadR family transcriptional regulator